MAWKSAESAMVAFHPASTSNHHHHHHHHHNHHNSNVYDTSSSTSGCQSSQSGTDEGVERSRSSSPISLNAFSNYIPKHGGQLIRNRIFVCGFGNNTAEDELRAFFEQYGNVKDVKVIADKTGSSKGYGFVTFESEEEAKRIIKEEQNNNKLNFKDRTLNIGPAVKREVARSTVQANLAAQLNHVLSAAAVPELTAGPALYYQSPAALAQVLLPPASYPTLATTAPTTLGMDPSSAYQYAYGNQTPFQYAVIGNQLVNYPTAPIFTASAPPINANQFIDHKLVQNAISGSMNAANEQQGQQTYQAQQQQQSAPAQGVYPSYPMIGAQQSLQSMYPSSDLLYYNRSGYYYQPQQQLSQANSMSSLTSDGVPYATATAPQSNADSEQIMALSQHYANQQHQQQSNQQPSKLADDQDLAHTLSTMAINNGSDNQVQSENEYPVYQQPQYAQPNAYSSIELVQAAAAAAWTYQQNLQQYAKSIANSSATSNLLKTSSGASTLPPMSNNQTMNHNFLGKNQYGNYQQQSYNGTHHKASRQSAASK